MVRKNFQIYGIQISGQCICRQNTYYATLGKTLPQVLITIPQTEGNYSILQAMFSRKSVLPRRKRGGETYMINILFGPTTPNKKRMLFFLFLTGVCM